MGVSSRISARLNRRTDTGVRFFAQSFRREKRNNHLTLSTPMWPFISFNLSIELFAPRAAINIHAHNQHHWEQRQYPVTCQCHWQRVLSPLSSAHRRTPNCHVKIIFEIVLGIYVRSTAIDTHRYHWPGTLDICAMSFALPQGMYRSSIFGRREMFDISASETIGIVMRSENCVSQAFTERAHFRLNDCRNH